MWLGIWSFKYEEMGTKEKMNLQELTFCIPVRIDSLYRERNLKTVLEFYSSQVECRYIVVEADTVRHIKDLPLVKGLEYEFVKDDNPIFHRTHYINKMLRQANTKLAAIWDTDIIAPIKQLEDAYDLLVSEHQTMVYPYGGCLWMINSFFSELFSRKRDIRLLEDFPMVQILMNGYNAVGGAFLVNIADYKKCGWENEYFIGWGPEDRERYKRLQILGQCPKRVEGPLFHLHHTRGINSNDTDKSLAYATKKEYCKVCGMQPDELREYIKTWDWIK